MTCKDPLPVHSSFLTCEHYVESLLGFVTSNALFQTLCGGVHILDFLTEEPDLYSTVLPADWTDWFSLHDISSILDLLLREDISILEHLETLADPESDGNATLISWRGFRAPPSSLLRYVLTVRRHALQRDIPTVRSSGPSQNIPRHIAVGMKPKKIHEVQNFARYVHELQIAAPHSSNHEISRIVDFGSGQNYLGRTLASPCYGKAVVALEREPHNIQGARSMDVHAKMAEKERHMRNKKLYRQTARGYLNKVQKDSALDNRPCEREEDTVDGDRVSETCLQASHNNTERIMYMETLIRNGDLSSVLKKVESNHSVPLQVMVVSLHSCGNLIHHGLRSLILNSEVKAVAMVGCCYNLMTERLGPRTFKLPTLRSQNERLNRTATACDPHGFPMSQRITQYPHGGGNGIRLNITARMMACQAPGNWTTQGCESFFTRHFYRALLQRIMHDRGIVGKDERGNVDILCNTPEADHESGPAITIGSLRKSCYASFVAYVHGAVQKMAKDPQHASRVTEGMQGLTDDEISSYEAMFVSKKKELSIVWSLMAFSASLVEAVILVDRWLYLSEQREVVKCWVEPVFEYNQSPRNLVVVGIKR